MSQENQQAVLNYYKAAEKGYWGDLGGRCHYGYTPENENSKFDMYEAQIKMERKLGEALALPRASKVLDAGCGWSPVARLLTKEFGYDVTGADLIHRRLKMGSEINKSEIVDIGLVNADYHYLPFNNESFDGIYTMETIVHAHPLKTVLSEFQRVLKPGGKVVLLEYSIPDLNDVPKIPRMLANRVIKNTGMSSLPLMVHGAWPSILESAGFVDAKAVDISRNVYPSWFYLWKLSLRNIFNEVRQGNISLDMIPGSTWIWPARKKLGYNICEAKKPVEI